uniref:Diacylglycerol kinase n=2 Tax=Lygus hesperus TaxID=30085 RepID=A0A0A9YX04_LYGHE
MARSGGEASGGSPTRSGSGVVTRVTPDWGEYAVESDHLWVALGPSSDFCYCGEVECTVSKQSKSGARYKCSSCKIICHTNCLSILERLKFACKPTFRDVGVRSYREQTTTKHHWVHRRQQKGKCKGCGKSFHSKLSFSTKDIVALNCSWCKDSYHNKESCFNSEKIEEDCSLGTHHPIIVPPAWIVKLPRRGSFKSSLRKSPKKKSSSKKKPSKERSESDASEPSVEKEERTFTLKPIPTSNVRPVIVFINPKSGGNQGIKLLQKFQWLLNPRQVFDLTQGGPRFGLELFRKVSNLRVLACGGDGTVGWVLSVIDQLGFNPPPAVGVLPLGTGNDLARALGWGGGYTDEPISKILYHIGESDVVQLDRWQLLVEKNPNGETSDTAKDNLPLNVVNNYFSMGVDAHIALEFHEAREAHPEKFNSRLKNKMFYGQMGGKDLVKRKWKGLADFVTLVCDDRDVTSILKEHKFHAIVFLNIPSYGGGTHPWPKQPGINQSTEDGLIEVVGLSTYQLPLLQAGGHGTSICQCKTATITTTKPIPMQVDGEACKLNPSVISLSLLNKAPMLAKKKGGRAINTQTVLEPLRISINMINMTDYEQYHNDKARLKQSAAKLGEIEITPVADLENTRQIIVQQIDTPRSEGRDVPVHIPKDWCFVDTCTAERFFRIDRAQEHLHYLTDIASDALYILDQTVATPDEDSAFTSMASAHQSPSSQVDETTPELSPSDEVPVAIKVNDSRVDGPSGGSKIERKEQPEVQDISSIETGYISSLLEKTTDGVVKAAKAGDIKKLKELHGHGYSLLSIDATGQTALHYSAQNGYKDVVKYLIASAPHSILNMADNEKGQTALHKAASNRHRSICCMLVAGGASLSLVDNFGNTPRLLALEAKDRQLANYLESQEQFQLLADDLEAS